MITIQQIVAIPVLQVSIDDNQGPNLAVLKANIIITMANIVHPAAVEHTVQRI